MQKKLSRIRDNPTRKQAKGPRINNLRNLTSRLARIFERTAFKKNAYIE